MRTMQGTKVLIMLVGVSASAWSTGCATTSSREKVSPGRIAQSDAAIQAAEEAGASTTNPSAALQLRMAREENEAAKKLASDQKDRRAETMLIRSVVDADLAKALALQTSTQLEAQKARDNLRELQENPAPPPATRISPSANPETTPPLPNKERKNDDDSGAR